MLIQHAYDIVAPLRILPYSVHIMFGSPRIAHQKDMLDIIALLSEALENGSEYASVEWTQENVEEIENSHNATWIVDLTHDVIYKEHQCKDSEGIGLDQIQDLGLLPPCPSRCIDIAKTVDENIAGDHKREQVVIIWQLKIITRTGSDDIEFYNISQDQRCCNDDCINEHIDPVQYLLIVSYHQL